jgi:RHS repeat-associated protein
MIMKKHLCRALLCLFLSLVASVPVQAQLPSWGPPKTAGGPHGTVLPVTFGAAVGKQDVLFVDTYVYPLWYPYGISVHLGLKNSKGTEINGDDWAIYGETENKTRTTGPVYGYLNEDCCTATGELRETSRLGVKEYAISTTRYSRPLYNMGGKDFDSALLIGVPDTQYGSLCVTEEGQFYKVELLAGEKLDLSGIARAADTRIGSLLDVDVFNEAREWLSGPVRAAPYAEAHFAGSFTNESGTDGTFYVRLKASFQNISDFKISFGNRAPKAPYNCDSCATDSPNGGSFGPSAGDPVNLASGRESNEAAPDIEVYNPNGPGVTWSRAFHTYQSLARYGSPGFSLGWVNNYDMGIEAWPGAWSPFTLFFTNGAQDVLTPELDAQGKPTGVLTGPAGAPYQARGVAGATVGVWTSITLSWKDGGKWKFVRLRDQLPNAGAGMKLTPLHDGVYSLRQVYNSLGKSITFNNDISRRLTSIVDTTSGQKLLSLSYNTSGTLKQVVDNNGRKVVYSHAVPSTSGIESYPAGASVKDLSLTKVSQVVASSATSAPSRWSYGYAGYFGRPLLHSMTVPSPAGSSASETSTAKVYYNQRAQVTFLQDANGNRRSYTYNGGTPEGNTKVQVKNKDGVLAASWTQYYDERKRDTGTADAKGARNRTEYGDPANPFKATKEIDEAGRVTQMSYDSYGNLLTVRSPRGIVTTYSYDYSAFALGRPVRIQEGSKPATTLTYFEPSGLVKSATGPHPNGSGTVTSSFTYDSLGNVLTATGPGNNAAATQPVRFNYSSDGEYVQVPKRDQPLAIQDSLGNVTHLRYDNRGNVSASWDALGHRTDITYNLADQVTLQRLPRTCQTGNGRGEVRSSYLYPGGPLQHTQVYDEAGALQRQVWQSYGLEGETLGTSGSTEPVTVTYDALYRRKSLQDDRGGVTSYSYDSVGNLSQVRYPDANSTTGYNTISYPLYTASGRLKQRIDGRGLVTEYGYDDPEGLLTEINYPASPAQSVRYSYNSYGRLQSTTNAVGKQSYTLNAADNLASVTQLYKKADGTDLLPQTLSYSYHADGSRAGMSTPGGSFAYSYDSGGRLTSLSNPQSKISRWTYLSNDWLKTQILGNGTKTTYSYNALGQVVGLANRNSNDEMLSQFGHATDEDLMLRYDAAGNMVEQRIEMPIPGSTSNYSGTNSYSYDSRNQLKREDSTRKGGYSNAFDYDLAGNNTKRTSSVGTGTASSWGRSFNASNQETTLSTQGKVQYVYDGAGNPTTYKGMSLSFDQDNKLTRWQNAGSSTASFKAGYGSDGKRAWKENGSGTRTYFLYDGDQIICELDGDGNLKATNTWGAAGLVSRRKLSKTSTGTTASTQYYSWDAGGNIAQRLDSNGLVQSSFVFNAYGGKLAGDSAGDPYAGYGGQHGYYTDGETGLILCTYRYYDPSNRRWLTRDPIGYEGGINLYGYVGNNPVNYVDPSGEFANVIGGAVVSVATGWVIAKLTGDCYSWKDAALDAATGAAGVGLFNKFRQLYRLRKLKTIADEAGLVAKASQKGTEKFAGDLGAQMELKNVGNILKPGGGLNPQNSWIPRARIKVAAGSPGHPAQYVDPFSGGVGSLRSPASHIPLQALPLTEAPLIGAGQGLANSAARNAAGY